MLDQTIRIEHDAFVGIDEDHNTVAETKGSRDLVGEVHMAWRVQNVQEEILVLQIWQENSERSRFDRHATLLFGEQRVRVSQLQGEKTNER